MVFIPQIMVVDDSRLARAAMESILRAEGYSDLILCDGPGQAMKALGVGEGAGGKQRPPDLILLDVEMPAISGIELCRIIKGSPDHRDAPIIMVTSRNELEVLAQAFEAGAMDYITKPPKDVELLARVRSALALKQEMEKRKAHEGELLRLTSRLTHAHQELLEKQRRLDEDLRAAAGIQKSLLPKGLPEGVVVPFAWEFQPSQFIGGDIFNIVELGPGLLGMYVVDVTGHGVPAALVSVAVFQALLPSNGLVLQGGRPVPPVRVLEALDREYPLERFEKTFTMVYAILDMASGELTFANAGHPRPLLFRAGGAMEELDEAAAPVGMGGLLPFTQGQRTMSPGDRLLLYTDGVVEQPSPAGDFFGLPRFIQTLSETRDLEPGRWLAEAKGRVLEFGGLIEPPDDITMVAIEYAD